VQTGVSVTVPPLVLTLAHVRIGIVTYIGGMFVGAVQRAMVNLARAVVLALGLALTKGFRSFIFEGVPCRVSALVAPVAAVLGILPARNAHRVFVYCTYCFHGSYLSFPAETFRSR